MKKRNNGKEAIQEIEKCILLIKEKTGAFEKLGDIKSTKIKAWVKYLVKAEYNIDLRCRFNWWEREDYEKGYFRNATISILHEKLWEDVGRI